MGTVTRPPPFLPEPRVPVATCSALYISCSPSAPSPGGGGGPRPAHSDLGPPVAGLKGRLDYLSSLKVKGVVLGPIHKTQRDDVDGTDLEQIDPALGSKEEFESLLQSAKKKSGCLC